MKKRLIIFAACIILVIVGVITTFVMLSTSDESAEAPKASVEVTGMGADTRLDPADDNELVHKAVQAMVRQNEPEATGTYSSIVRKSSITRSTASNGQPKLRYLIDIPELQRSFVVEREGDLNSDYATLYVTCPTPSELKYPEKSCRAE